MKSILVVLIAIATLPVAACGSTTTPTSPSTTSLPPTMTRPTSVMTGRTTPTRTSARTSLTTAQTPPSEGQNSITGQVSNIARFGANGLDVTFRINDFTVVRAASGTPVTDLARHVTGQTDIIGDGQTVEVDGVVSSDGGPGFFIDAQSIEILSEGPEPIAGGTPPPLEPPPAITDDATSTNGQVGNIARGGPGGLDITFRIDDFTIVRAAGNVPVTDHVKNIRGLTDIVGEGQTVSVIGIRTSDGGEGFIVDAQRIDILAEAPTPPQEPQ